MTTYRWKNVKEILGAALELEADEREAFVSGACGDDQALGAEVRSLIRSYEEDPAFIDAPAGAGGLGAEALGPRRIDERVGPYRLTEVIASGGMGTVYLGVRADDEYRRRVAIKFITAPAAAWGRDPARHAELLRRFRAERQTLADLDHPNICKLLDGGTTDDGVPYLVMEYLDAKPIDEYCRERRLSITERLVLFQQVCAAVRCAHQHLVIHRDIKPTNILVTSEGSPKLVDFGIAKLLDDGAARQPTLTQADARPMTPRYASPEQILGRPVTTASDVYSLGVVLYVLLTGQPPYRVATDAVHEIARAVCEQDPVKPSTRVVAPDTAAPLIEQSQESPVPPPHPPHPGAHGRRDRAISPARLRRRLAGDLDTIVLMALRKEPSRRYASVEQFSEDIRRHLKGLPVIARADTVGYRTAKFARRNQIAVAAGALTAMTLVGGIAGTTWQAVAASRAGKLAANEAVVSRSSLGFMEELFQVFDPEEGLAAGETKPTVEEMLQRGAKRIAELDAGPEAKARLLAIMGKAYYGIGRYVPARGMLEQALEIQDRALGRTHEDTLATLETLGRVLTDLKEYVLAEPIVTAAWEGRRASLGPGHRDTIKSMNSLGRLRRLEGRIDEARPLCVEAVEQARLSFGDEHAVTLEQMNNLAVFLGEEDQLDQAEALLVKIVEAQPRVLSDEHPQALLWKSNLARVLMGRGDYPAAERLLKEVIEARGRVLPHGHPHTVSSMVRLGNVLRSQETAEKFAEAEEVLLRALAAETDVPGDGEPNLADLRIALSLLRSAQKRPEEAESILMVAVEEWCASRGDGDPVTLKLMNALGALLMRQKRYNEAEGYLRRAAEAAVRTPAVPPRTAVGFRTNYGVCLTRLKEFERAEMELLAVETMVTKWSRRWKVQIYTRLIDLYDAWGRSDMANQYRALARSTDVTERPPPSGDTLENNTKR